MLSHICQTILRRWLHLVAVTRHQRITCLFASVKTWLYMTEICIMFWLVVLQTLIPKRSLQSLMKNCNTTTCSSDALNHSLHCIPAHELVESMNHGLSLRTHGLNHDAQCEQLSKAVCGWLSRVSLAQKTVWNNALLNTYLGLSWSSFCLCSGQKEKLTVPCGNLPSLWVMLLACMKCGYLP